MISVTGTAVRNAECGVRIEIWKLLMLLEEVKIVQLGAKESRAGDKSKNLCLNRHEAAKNDKDSSRLTRYANDGHSSESWNPVFSL